MTKDAFGHEVEFRTIMRVGAQRADGKFPVLYVFTSTGKRFNKIMTRAQIDADIEDSINRGSPMEVHGWISSTH